MVDETLLSGRSGELNGKGSDLGVFIVVPPIPGNGGAGSNGEVIVRFLDQPAISETRSARYQPESLLHAPESFNAYEGTDQRELTIEGKFFCQKDEDIRTNNNVLHVIRSLVMPDYNATGSPPTPVRLHAYGSHNIHGLPCLVRSYNMDWPNDVDYVSSGEITMPVVFTLGITLVEQHSVTQLREFSLAKFRNGTLVTGGF